jgi:hypothetical protein
LQAKPHRPFFRSSNNRYFQRRLTDAAVVVDPGDTFATELRVWGARPNQNSGPAFDVADPSGTYRLVWDAAAWSRQNGSQPVEPMPLEYRISNRFVLTVQ